MTPHLQIVFKTFIMVFFAEWGDRSQFSTIALAGTHPISSGTAPFRSFSNAVVILGAAAGYVVATLCGVLGGDYFARVLSPRVISISGGILFAVQILITKISLVCSTNTPSMRRLHLRWHSLRHSNPHHENLSHLFHKHAINTLNKHSAQHAALQERSLPLRRRELSGLRTQQSLELRRVGHVHHAVELLARPQKLGLELSHHLDDVGIVVMQQHVQLPEIALQRVGLVHTLRLVVRIERRGAAEHFLAGYALEKR